MRNFQILSPLFVAIVATVLTGWTGSAQTVQAQTSQQNAARANWTPQRGNPAAQASDSDAAYQPATQPKHQTATRAVRPQNRVRQAAHQTPARTQQSVQQTQHQVVHAPHEGEIIYEGYDGAVVDGSCDALGTCGCDAIGCDAMGSCGPSCGCSMCGELPSGRAWRPAVTLSLPQDGWVSFEAMHLWQDGMNLPTLLSTSPNGTNQVNAGVLGRSGTQVYGGSVLEDAFDGGRLRFGIWLDRCHSLGLGGELMQLGEETERFSQTSTGDPILARPFFNTLTGRADSELVAFPGVVSGTATINVRSELSGGSVYLRKLRCCDEGCSEWLFCGCNGHYCSRSEFRFGYRHMKLDEGVSINETLTGANPGELFNINDHFKTLNEFNGVDVGWSRRITRGYWTYEGLVRIAAGNTKQTVTASGQTVINGTDTFDEGFLAIDPYVGQYEQDEFSVIPELNLTLGYQLTDHLKATLGYTAIYWSNVVRPGEHIPTMLNPEGLPPDVTAPTADAMPVFAFDTVDYWAHGITYGLEYRW